MTPRHRLHIVSGKGGTGKTTVAAALACALATAGRRVLLCEVEGRQGIAELFGASRLVDAEERRICRTPPGGAVHASSIDAEAAFLEYLETFYHLGLAAKALDRFGVVDFATSIAPGLRDVLLTGKVYEAVRRGEKNRPNSYDAVVLDAPPTGRIAQFLNVHQAVAGLARVGPIRGQADSIMRMLRSTTTAVHLVTLLEEMPVTETEEAVAALRPTGISVETVIANVFLWAGSPFYAEYVHAVAPWGVSASEDQGLAGAVMLAEGGVVTLVGLAWLFLRLAEEGEARQRLLERGLDPRAVRRAVRYGRWRELERQAPAVR